LLYSRGTWRPVPETVAPPRALMGVGRNEGEERVWAALVSIPVDDKNQHHRGQGPGRAAPYNGHLHGRRTPFVTGQWRDGSFKVASQEDIALELTTPSPP